MQWGLRRQFNVFILKAIHRKCVLVVETLISSYLVFTVRANDMLSSFSYPLCHFQALVWGLVLEVCVPPFSVRPVLHAARHTRSSCQVITEPAAACPVIVVRSENNPAGAQTCGGKEDVDLHRPPRHQRLSFNTRKSPRHGAI